MIGLTYLGNPSDIQDPSVAKTLTNIESIYIINPGSSTYAYAIWIYVIGKQQSITDGTIFKRNGELELKYNGSNLYLITPGNPAISGTSGTSGTLGTSVTNNIYLNMPIQRWVQVIVNVGLTNIDVYINGRLTNNYINNNNVVVPSSNPLIFNTIHLPLFISNFQRWGNQIDTSTAYSSYMSGNGTGSSLLPSINITASILKDGEVQAQRSMF